MTPKQTYTKKEVDQLVAKEVEKQMKGKGYSYSKWAFQNFIAGIFGVILLIIIIAVFDALSH
jgi:hypothetical protein